MYFSTRGNECLVSVVGSYEVKFFESSADSYSPNFREIKQFELSTI